MFPQAYWKKKICCYIHRIIELWPRRIDLFKDSKHLTSDTATFWGIARSGLQHKTFGGNTVQHITRTVLFKLPPSCPIALYPISCCVFFRAFITFRNDLNPLFDNLFIVYQLLYIGAVQWEYNTSTKITIYIILNLPVATLRKRKTTKMGGMNLTNIFF